MTNDMKKSVSNISMMRNHDVYTASIAGVTGSLKDLIKSIQILHPEELSRFDKFKYNRRKISYLLGRFSAKQAIKALTGISNSQKIWIESGVFQFPVVNCKELSNIQVSISHCENIGICIAFPEVHPMGIDLEKISLSNLDVVSSQLTSKEKKLLENIPLSKIEGYTAIWSIKESLSKVLKTGMMINFELLEIDQISIKDNIIENTFKNFKQYKALSFIKGGYVFSITLPRRTSVNLNQVWELLDTITITNNIFSKT